MHTDSTIFNDLFNDYYIFMLETRSSKILAVVKKNTTAECYIEHPYEFVELDRGTKRCFKEECTNISLAEELYNNARLKL